ncbi:hypothetical protein [Streptomyces sp. GC420]|uniref:hypothetical protein n=1 Tax=Streptomyces sp. GC420 TaxID=2697568 RepID=UPI001AA14083|nr:hypothetical protein [Streptomyces sp. GC420]
MRLAAIVACLVLGVGLLGGAAAGALLAEDSAAGGQRTVSSFAAARGLWHSVPVDTLFPPVVKGGGAGPGGADRRWTRVAVAPASACDDAFDPLLRKALQPVGCVRVLRASYVDETRSSVTTVGMLFTETDARGMRALRTRFESEGLGLRPDLMPRTYAAEGTPAENFGDDQRASWTVSVLTDTPAVVFAVSGFADGRKTEAPEPAEEARQQGATSAPAQAGLGHEAKGLADRIERGLRRVATGAAAGAVPTDAPTDGPAGAPTEEAPPESP